MVSDGIFMISGAEMAVHRSAPYETEAIRRHALADFQLGPGHTRGTILGCFPMFAVGSETG